MFLKHSDSQEKEVKTPVDWTDNQSDSQV
jgi:hypothetical protein